MAFGVKSFGTEESRQHYINQVQVWLLDTERDFRETAKRNGYTTLRKALKNAKDWPLEMKTTYQAFVAQQLALSRAVLSGIRN